nr:MAG TPA: hypothetical protein [Caudoviricetes sp.]
MPYRRHSFNDFYNNVQNNNLSGQTNWSAVTDYKDELHIIVWLLV